jgi:hypothetical protein
MTTTQQLAERARKLAHDVARDHCSVSLGALINCIGDLETIAAQEVPYPLPDALYAGSKDWAASNYAGRVEWLHAMYESKKRELETLYAWLESKGD